MTVTIAGGVASVTVTGDGTLVFDDGSTLAIARGSTTARAFVKVR